MLPTYFYFHNSVPFVIHSSQSSTKAFCHYFKHISIMPRPAASLKHCQFPGCDYKNKKPKEMRRHEQIHSTDPEIRRPHKCSSCSYRASVLTLLKHHILMQHSEEAPTYKCSVLGCRFETKVRTYLQSHKKARHSQSRPISCTFDGCEYRAKTTYTVREHFLKCHDHEANPEKDIHCPMCSKRFHLTHKLQFHLRTHMKEKPWQCSLCNYESKKKELLLHHRESAHGEIVKAVHEGRHQCKLCDFSTSFLVRFNYHVRHHHSEERPYACSFPQCSLKFKRNGDLKIHQTLHVPEKHPCPQPNCSYVAKNKHLLTAHRRIHKNPFPCVFPNCNTKFRTEVSLLNHQRLHDPNRPFQCNHCPQGFNSKGELCTHVKRLHEETKEFTSRTVGKRSTVYFKGHEKIDKLKVRKSPATACQVVYKESNFSNEHSALCGVAVVIIPQLKVCVY